MDRLRHLASLLLILALLPSCEEKAASRSGRFDGVRSESVGLSPAARAFCESAPPASGPGSRRFVEPVTRPIAGYTPPPPKAVAWRWVNLWATWCGPCVGEIPLLGKWANALNAEGTPLQLDLYSVDEDAQELSEALAKPMPGRVLWTQADALPALLKSFGLEETAPIPVHALVDPNGQVRCVRVGSVRESDFGAIRSIVTGK